MVKVQIKIKGLKEAKAEFRQFRFTASKNIQKQFMETIARQTLFLLRANTPVDTGQLKRSWAIMGRGENYIDVGVGTQEMSDRLFFVTEDNRFGPGNKFLFHIQNAMLDLVIGTLEQVMRRNHPFFKNLSLRGQGGGNAGFGKVTGGVSGRVSIRGKGRKFLAVGRTSAAMTGGKRGTGSQLKRVGTGKKSFSRKLSLRRRRGPDVKTTIKALLA